MAPDASLWRSNGRQIDFCVPPNQEIEVSNDLAELMGSQVEVERSQQIADIALGQHRHKRHCNSGVNVCRRVDIQHKWRVASALRSSRQTFRLVASLWDADTRAKSSPSKPLIYKAEKFRPTRPTRPHCLIGAC